jgi:hypothetical protein
MSAVAIRAALETALNGMSPALSTAFENVAFTPVAGTAYQQVNVLFAEPDNLEFGSHYREIGYMQVKLMYPLQVGTATVAARAELIRTTFRRGASFTSGGVTVTIEKTPEIGNAQVEGDRYAMPVRVRFFANI